MSMARPLERRSIVASLFDRLTDSEPANSREVPPPEWDQRENYRLSVARDLTNLLNTRRNEADIPEEFELTRESILAYGLQDFTVAPVDRETVRRGVERTIRRFEPRLSRVQVVVTETNSLTYSFRISAVLRLDLSAEPVEFDASLPVESRRFRVVTGR